MEIHLRIRNKVQIHTLSAGATCRLIEKTQCFLILDLTQTDMFRAPQLEATPPDQSSVPVSTGPYLRNDVVYVSDIITGIVSIVPKTQEVYQVWLRADEVDEGK